MDLELDLAQSFTSVNLEFVQNELIETFGGPLPTWDWSMTDFRL